MGWTSTLPLCEDTVTDKRRDFLWVLSISMVILLWGSLPTWAGYRAETEDLRFCGIYYDCQDYAVHIAAMEAGQHGEWAYQFRFTTEPHHPAYIRLFYITLGHLSRVFRLPSELTFQLARWILGFLALLALYRLMQRIFPDLFWARVAFLLAAAGSGLGWLQLIFNWTTTIITPIDFWLIDDYVFFSLSVFPHFAFVTLAMCITLNLWFDFLKQLRWINIAWIGLTAILVQFVNPIAFATVDISLFGAALFAWWQSKVVRKEDVIALFVIAVAQLPLLAYNFFILNQDRVWSQFTAQNQTLSPPTDYYLWGFALLWLPAIFGIGVSFRTKSSALGAAVLWIVSGFLLAYAPFGIQRRFLQNLTIPLAILANAGLAKLFETAAARCPGMRRWQSPLVALYLFLTCLSSIYMGIGQVAYVQTHPRSLYYPASLDLAIAWFEGNAHYNDFVIASEQTSQILVQKAGLRAYFGHEMETLFYQTKRQEVQAFFEGQKPDLANMPVKWIVYGPSERKLDAAFEPTANMELLYEIPDLQIYLVK